MSVCYIKEDMSERDFSVFSEFICSGHTRTELLINKLIEYIDHIILDKNTIKIDYIDAQMEATDSIARLAIK